MAIWNIINKYNIKKNDMVFGGLKRPAPTNS